MNERTIAYRNFARNEKSLPIFMRDWWLDAVCGDKWDVSVVERGGVIVAAMPYTLKQRYGMTIITQPPLTQTLGPWLKLSNGKYSNSLGHEKDLLAELISQLPTFSDFKQSWNFKNTNWLPFYWQGFHQTTRYTYRLEDLTDLDVVWSEFSENIRREIRKASNRFKLKVRTDLDLNDFLELNHQTYNRQGKGLPYSIEFINRLDRASAENNSRQIFIAEDLEGKRHAGVYIVWDEQSAYYLLGGADPKLRSSGASSLCLWEAIKFSSTKTKSFDFEGSMIEPIERYFRAFGAIQTPYFLVSKTPSRVVRMKHAIMDILR